MSETWIKTQDGKAVNLDEARLVHASSFAYNCVSSICFKGVDQCVTLHSDKHECTGEAFDEALAKEQAIVDAFLAYKLEHHTLGSLEKMQKLILDRETG